MIRLKEFFFRIEGTTTVMELRTGHSLTLTTTPEGDTCAFLEQISPALCDDHFEVFKRNATAKGRGRRVALPADVRCNNRLLLQLFLIREKEGQTWDELRDLFSKLCPSLPVSRLRWKVEHCVKLARDLATSGEPFGPFLDVTLSFNSLGTISDSYGIYESDILGDPEDLRSYGNTVQLTNGFVMEIKTFAKKKKIPLAKLKNIFQSLGALVRSDTDFAKILNETEGTYRRTNKSKSRKGPDGVSEFDKFSHSLCKLVIESRPVDIEPDKMDNTDAEDRHEDSDNRIDQEEHGEPVMDNTDAEDRHEDSDNRIDQEEHGEPVMDNTDAEDRHEDSDNRIDQEEHGEPVMDNTDAEDRHEDSDNRIDQEEHGEPVIVKPASEHVANLAAMKQARELRALKGRLEESNKENSELREQLGVCSKECSHHAKRANLLEKELSDRKEELNLKALQREHSKLQTEFGDIASELLQYKNGTKARKLREREKNVTENEKILRQHKDNGCQHVISSLKDQVKRLQTECSTHLKALSNFRSNKSTLKAEITKLKSECDAYIIKIEDLEAIAGSNRKLVTKSGTVYSNEIVKCIIQLIGEVNIPAGRCAPAIKCIANCLFDCKVEMKDLPSIRTTGRFADRGHVLAKYHVTDSILQNDRYDMHSDATSRDHRKYLGNQITLSSGNIMSLGYMMMQTEDASSLLDAAITILKELADIHGFVENAADTEATFKELVRKLSALMSDRASVNKAYNREFDKKRKEIIGDESAQLEFIYCNAHFLLGLSSESEKVLKQLQKAIGDGTGKLGRDKLNQFKSFSSAGESAVSRFIRTACDVLGPRGDDKSGCRDAWEAYCHLQGERSLVKSYRSNRFNNFFEGAGTLHFHRKGIQDFFSNYSESPNLKLQSVLADCQDDDVDTMLSAVGITFFMVTGPYWRLITSQTVYLDLYKFITPMREKFELYSKDASGILENQDSVIPEFAVEGGEVMLHCTQTVKKPELFVKTLQALFAGFLAVTDRQLQDFLPGGRYYDVQDQAIREKMSHCQLTNLIGEQNLGDLDYSLFMRRHASLHYRSFINMMQRNRTMSSWFLAKTKTEQGHLLSLSAKKAAPLRKKHRDAEKLKKKEQKLLNGRRISLRR
ncbi:uncharacterized protein LOC135493239 isoform X1 [Lineus longissimus]|uniref:uncharacterized protein LOC135493239 isoform X1 n=2 Tax=Lineus longissimus TaxID=88925 RepID=UPI00315C9371